MVSRQERRRHEMMKIRMIDNPFKPNPKILCPFDKEPCQRPRSPIDGNLECGGITYGSSNGNETEIIPICERLRPITEKP